MKGRDDEELNYVTRLKMFDSILVNLWRILAFRQHTLTQAVARTRTHTHAHVRTRTRTHTHAHAHARTLF